MACKLRSLSQNSDRCIKVAAAYLVLCIMYDVLCVLCIVLYVLILYIVLYTICYMPYVVLYVIYHIDISYIILRCIKVAAAYLALCVQVSRDIIFCDVGAWVLRARQSIYCMEDKMAAFERFETICGTIYVERYSIRLDIRCFSCVCSPSSHRTAGGA